MKFLDFSWLFLDHNSRLPQQEIEMSLMSKSHNIQVTEFSQLAEHLLIPMTLEAV